MHAAAPLADTKKSKEKTRRGEKLSQQGKSTAAHARAPFSRLVKILSPLRASADDVSRGVP